MNTDQTPWRSPRGDRTPLEDPTPPQDQVRQHEPVPHEAWQPGAGSPLARTPDPTPSNPQRPPAWRMVVAAAAASAVLTAGAMTAVGAVLPVTSSAPAVSEPHDGSDSGTTAVPAAVTGPADWSQVAATVRTGVVAVQVSTGRGGGEGAGVVLDDAGNILTNEHVVSGARDVQVTLDDGRVHDATIVGTDETTDLAVIRLDKPPTDLEPATFGDSAAVVVGQPVMAVGNPLGLDATVTTGIVSAVDRPVTTSGNGREPVVTNAIQVDAAINPGNSGGPLVDAAGHVIGITSSIASLSGGASGSIGLGFAIPSNLADRVATALITDGAAQHAYLGVTLSDATVTVADTTRLGARIEQVLDGSAAATADLRTGDVVVAVDGSPVSGATALTAFIRERAVDQEVTLTVVRDGKPVTAGVTLTAREDAPRPKA